MPNRPPPVEGAGVEPKAPWLVEDAGAPKEKEGLGAPAAAVEVPPKPPKAGVDPLVVG